MIMLIFSLVFSSVTFASIPELKGEFSFRGDFRAEVAIEYLNVPVFNDKQREYLNSLIKAGYNCYIVKSTMYQCRRSEGISSFPEEIVQRINKNLSALKVEFSEGSFSKEILYEGDSYQEWIVNQPVNVNGKAYPNYRLMVLPSLTKIVIGNTGIGEYWSFIFINDNNLEFMIDYSKSKSDGWTRFVGFLNINKHVESIKK